MRFLAALLSASILFAGSPAAKEPQEPPAKSFRIPVSTEEADLDPANFKVTINGKPARIIKAQPPSSDLLLLIILDLTADFATIDRGRRALIEELGKLPPNVWIGLMKSQESLEVIADPASEREPIISGIENTPVGGKAGMIPTLPLAAMLADNIAKKTQPRVAVLYFTDSNIYNYREDYTNPVINSGDSRDLSRRFQEGLIREKLLKLQETLAKHQSPLFFLHIDYRSDVVNEAYQSGLITLAESTGGRGLICRTDAEIPDATKKIFDLLIKHWSLEVELPNPVPRSLQAVVENDGRNLMYRARTLIGGR